MSPIRESQLMTRSGLSRRLALVAVVATGLLFAQEASAATTHWVNVNGSSFTPPGTSCNDPGYPTIQSAVNAAISGDVVNVCPGTYRENIVIGTSDVTVISTDGPAVTTVRAAAVNVDTFRIAYVQGVTIDGFTIVPAGLYAKHDIGVNVYVDGNASATIIHNRFFRGRIGVNLGCGSSASTVADNTVSGQSEAAINIDTCEGSESGSDGNRVHHNTACGGTFAYSIAAGEKSDNNEIHNNTAMWITVYGTGNAVHHNTAEYFAIGPGNSQVHNTTDPNACP
jgi:hypothetical protein